MSVPLGIMVVGPVGVGKSSVANALLGHQTFQIARSLVPVTQQCAAVSTDDGEFHIVDTPGIEKRGTTRLEQDDPVLEQLRLSVAHADPPIAALVFVLSLAAHVSSDEAAMNGLSLVFGPEWPARTVFVWSNAEILGSSSLREYLHTADGGLQQLLGQAGGGSIEIDTCGAEEHVQEQVAKILAAGRDIAATADAELETSTAAEACGVRQKLGFAMVGSLNRKQGRRSKLVQQQQRLGRSNVRSFGGLRSICNSLCQLFHAVPSSAVDTRHLSDEEEVDGEHETIELIEGR